MFNKSRPFVPLSLNITFSLLCLLYLQFKGQEYYLLGTEIIVLVFASFIGISAQFNLCPKIASIDLSPMFFTILFLTEFTSLLSIGERQQISENLLSLLIGCVLGLQKIAIKDKEQRRRYWNVKITGHAISLLLIYIVIILNKDGDDFVSIVIAAILVLIVYIFDLFQKNNKNLIEQKEIDVGTVNQMTRSLTQQQQANSNNIYGLWEKLLEQQIFFVTQRNNDVHVDKMSSSLLQHLKDKNLTINELLKKTQLCSIQLESENILTNNMIEIKTSLSTYLKELLLDEKLSGGHKKRRSQREVFEDSQQKLISPSGESRSRLQSYQRSEQLQKNNTLQLNNSFSQFVSNKDGMTESLREIVQLLNNRYDSNQSGNKKQVFYGLIQYDEISSQQIKITLIYYQEKSLSISGYLVEIQDYQNQLKQMVNYFQLSYKFDVTLKQSKQLSKMIDETQSKFNNLFTQQKDNKQLGQIWSSIYQLDIQNTNFLYFLSEDIQIRPHRVELKKFLKSIISKFKYDELVIKKNIDIRINHEQLQYDEISTDVQLFSQIIVNLFYNAIKAYTKPDIENIVQINLSDTQNDEILFEIIDKAGGFQQQLDYKRVRDCKLGIYIVQKLLPYLSKLPKLEYRALTFGNSIKGCLVKFTLPRNLNQQQVHNDNLQTIDQTKLAQLQISQQFNYIQYNI